MAPIAPVIIVPVRRASTRLPNKPLHKIAGKELVLHVAERLEQVAPEYETYFAVDDTEVCKLLELNGFRAIMTDPNLPSGTDRIAAANRIIKAKHVINCQGDEPRVERLHIDLLSQCLRMGAPMATIALNDFTAEEFANPNRPKVITNADGNALYFSRACIPYCRDLNGALPPQASRGGRVGLHQGFYAYTADFLERFTQLPPTPLEKMEKLEQLRALEYGYPIAVRFNNFPTQGIDTPEDVKAFEKILNADLVNA